jgi:hypothetical protein
VELHDVEIVRPHAPQALVARINYTVPAIVVEARQWDTVPGPFIGTEHGIIQGAAALAGQVEFRPAVRYITADMLLRLSVIDSDVNVVDPGVQRGVQDFARLVL